MWNRAQAECESGALCRCNKAINASHCSTNRIPVSRSAAETCVGSRTTLIRVFPPRCSKQRLEKHPRCIALDDSDVFRFITCFTSDASQDSRDVSLRWPQDDRVVSMLIGWLME